MGKPKPINAFSLIEMLVVLLIVSICMMGIHVSTQVPLFLFMKQLQSRFLVCQQKAFCQKEDIAIEIRENQALFDSDIWTYPMGIACSPGHYSFNANGNISRAGTIRCTNSSQQRSLVLQLGSGRSRIE